MSRPRRPPAVASSLGLAACLALAPTLAPPFQEPPPPAAERPRAAPEDVATVEAIVAATYASISGPAGERRDWDRFRSLFHPELGRLAPVSVAEDGSATVRGSTPAEYARRSQPYFDANAFYEREIAARVERFGHVAHVFSTYESVRSPEDAEPFQRGINSFQLAFDGRRWSILSITWDAEREGQEIPAEYLPRPR